MLSEGAIKCLAFGLSYSKNIGSTPYKWLGSGTDKGKAKKQAEQLVGFSPGNLRKVLWFLHNFIYDSYLVFVFCQCIRLAFFDPDESFTSPRTISTCYIFCAYSFCTAIQWSVWKNYGVHHIWINSFLQYIQEFQNRHPYYQKEMDRVQSDCSKNLRVFKRVVFLVFVLDFLSLVEKPDQPYFLTSLFIWRKDNDDELGKIWIRQASIMIPLALVHAEIWTHMYGTFFFFGNSLLCYLTAVKNILLELDQKRLRGDSHEFLEEFRRLEILQGFCNHLWSSTIAMYETELLLGVILAYYGAVRLDGSRAAQQCVVALFLTFHILNLWKYMGDIHDISTQILQSWKQRASTRLFKRELRAMRAIRVNIGSFFYADRSIRLTILAIIFEKTSSFLLSTQ